MGLASRKARVLDTDRVQQSRGVHLVAHALGAAEHDGLGAARLGTEVVLDLVHLVVGSADVDDLPDILHATQLPDQVHHEKKTEISNNAVNCSPMDEES